MDPAKDKFYDDMRTRNILLIDKEIEELESYVKRAILYANCAIDRLKALRECPELGKKYGFFEFGGLLSKISESGRV